MFKLIQPFSKLKPIIRIVKQLVQTELIILIWKAKQHCRNIEKRFE
ncbi:hypothetical protein [Bacillus oleivorans]|nr:hypothetical protein [Bacillus oleivorans]